MNQLNCPNCGPRNLEEFRYGGEVQRRPDPPVPPVQDDSPGGNRTEVRPAGSPGNDHTATEWTRYLYTRRNPRGVLDEWWYHRLGCGSWFIARRHTHTHEVQATYFWSADRRT